MEKIQVHISLLIVELQMTEYSADNGSPLGNDNGNGDLARRCAKGGGVLNFFKEKLFATFFIEKTLHIIDFFSQEVDLKKAMFFKARDFSFI